MKPITKHAVDKRKAYEEAVGIISTAFSDVYKYSSNAEFRQNCRRHLSLDEDVNVIRVKNTMSSRMMDLHCIRKLSDRDDYDGRGNEIEPESPRHKQKTSSISDDSRGASHGGNVAIQLDAVASISNLKDDSDGIDWFNQLTCVSHP